MQLGLNISQRLQVGSWLLLVMFAIAVGGCGMSARASCDPTSTPAPVTETEVTLEAGEIRASWQQTGHANSFVESAEGNNQECARCHARVDWRPPLSVWPSSWGQPAIEYQAGPSEISQENWSHVDCQVCHPAALAEDFEQIAWLAIPPIGEYQSTESNSQLCLNCHAEADLPDHDPVEIDGAHRELSCLECHDPHQGGTSCTQSGCHLAFDEACAAVTGHSKPHQAVTCQGCHAVGDYQVYWAEALEQWGVQAKSQDRSRAAAVAIPHNLSAAVECERCHTPGELPWMQ